jgi:WXG100 family type VII secretion target
VSFWSDVEGIFDPGGDPAAIHAAAAACRALASEQRSAVSALEQTSQHLAATWKGSANGGFEQAWSKFSGAITQYAKGLDNAATQLDKIADEIQSAQEQATRLKEMALASLAVGVGLTIFTFGASDAAAEAAVMTDVAVATGVMSSLDAVLADAAAFLSDLWAAFAPIAARFVMGAGLSLISEMLTKSLQGLNPVDPANYTAGDVANIILGGILTAGMGQLAADTPALNGFLNGHPILGTASYGAAGGILGSGISQLAIQGKPLDLDTLLKVGESGGISFISGGALGIGMAKVPALGAGSGSDTLPDLTTTPGPITKALNGFKETTGITGGDVVRGSIGIPSGAASYVINYPAPTPGPTGPNAPAAPSGVPVPAIPAPPPPDTAQVVKPGDNLWDISGGTPADVARAAKLNKLDDPNLIYPHEVIVLPGGSGS